MPDHDHAFTNLVNPNLPRWPEEGPCTVAEYFSNGYALLGSPCEHRAVSTLPGLSDGEKRRQRGRQEPIHVFSSIRTEYPGGFETTVLELHFANRPRSS